MVDWLKGIPAKLVCDDVYEIIIDGYGPADVGPYDQLRKHVGTYSQLECHHIVEQEHLELVSTRFTNANAPAVAIPVDLHRKLISGRFSAEQTYLGGRRGGKAAVSKVELLDLYRQVYTFHTPFRQLNLIAAQILY